MNDIKNIFLAWLSVGSPLLTAISSDVAILSAIVLPIVFFAVGKTIDVLLQIHFRARDRKSDKEEGS